MTTYTNSHVQTANDGPPRWWNKTLTVLVAINCVGIGAQLVRLEELLADAAEVRAAKVALDSDAQRVREILQSSRIACDRRALELDARRADSVSNL